MKIKIESEPHPLMKILTKHSAYEGDCEWFRIRCNFYDGGKFDPCFFITIDCQKKNKWLECKFKTKSICIRSEDEFFIIERVKRCVMILINDHEIKFDNTISDVIILMTDYIMDQFNL